jgi:hypothetical protein
MGTPTAALELQCLDGLVRWEMTAYAGTHWVEAFVVKDNVCVGRSGRKLVKVWH